MDKISLLSQDTIDKIAAGEVVERPASVVKELVENAVDAGANAVTVEIKDGGLSLIRITDNGCGIPKDQVRAAFLRHATSKIRTVDDLLTAGTLGFRGEALSSIAAVCQVEMITKTPGSLFGVRYVIEGGVEMSFEEIGAPEGTTFLVRNLFYHTPARRKFLKTATTEAGYVSDLMERLALSHPNIAFKFINNRDTRLHTSGNGKMKDIIYAVYGRDVASNIVNIETNASAAERERGGDSTASARREAASKWQTQPAAERERGGDSTNGAIRINGYIGKPVISRGNRNYENYFVNGRYVRSAIISRAIEDAYKPFLMSHRYPLTALMINIDTDQVDVNVHPTKMEVRFADQSLVYDRVYNTVKEGLLHRELIPEFTIETASAHRAAVSERQTRHAAERERGGDSTESAHRAAVSDQSDPSDCVKTDKESKESRYRYPEPFEKVRSQLLAESQSPYEPKYPEHLSTAQRFQNGGCDLPPSAGEGAIPDHLPTAQRFQNGRCDLPPSAGEGAIPDFSGLGKKPGVLKPVTGTIQNDAVDSSAPPENAPDTASAHCEAVSEWQTRHAAERERGGDSTKSAHCEAVSEWQTRYAAERERGGDSTKSAHRAAVSEWPLSSAAGDKTPAKPVQMELFDEKLLSEQNVKQHKLIGQVFGTYWIVEFQDKMYIIDQHAAHEKVLYERFMKNLAEKKQTSQMITPPIIVSLSMQEEEMLKKHMERFVEVGFEIEPFGGREYSICAVPGNLYSLADQNLFLEMLDGLTDISERASDQAIREKIASMSCKAAVKGNHRLQTAEIDALIGELLTLENPYNCPHGRPTIIAMTKYELEKKFKRIV